MNHVHNILNKAKAMMISLKINRLLPPPLLDFFPSSYLVLDWTLTSPLLPGMKAV
jgi:hypothetical protein